MSDQGRKPETSAPSMGTILDQALASKGVPKAWIVRELNDFRDAGGSAESVATAIMAAVSGDKEKQ